MKPDPSDDLTPSAPVSAAAGLTLKAALTLGFGITLGTWLVAGYQMTERMREVEAQTEAISARYERSQDLLTEVSTQVLISSMLIRDALLDGNTASGPSYQQRFEAAFSLADAALRQYEPVLNIPSEHRALASLREEIDDLHAEMLEVFGTDPRDWPRDAHRRLEERVVPKRMVVIGISDQIRRLNRDAFIQRQADTRDLNGAAQQQALRRIGLAVGASLLVGVVATVYASRLESRLRRQRVRDLRITSDLQNLSARLATAQEDERRAIARELHDEVGQALAAMKVELSNAQRTPGVPAAAIERLNEARVIAETTVGTIRNLSNLLHPPLLDDLGLAAALKQQLETFTKRHGIRAELVHEPSERRLSPELEVALYRVVQEALTNIAKHAHARSCHVSVRDLPASVQVTIEDDGSGFDAVDMEQFGHTGGLGLIGIRERAQQLGGTFQIDTAPGRGTRLTVEMPAAVHAAAGVPPDIHGHDSRHEVGAHGKPSHLAR